MSDHPKFCPHCGTPVPDYRRFCVSCGKEVVTIVQVAPAPAPAPVPSAEPKKRPSMLGYALVTLVFLLGCYWLFSGVGRTPRPYSPSVAASGGHKVEYRILGSTGRVDLTYQNGSGATEQKDDARVPWNLSFTARSGQFVYVSAQNQQSSGTVKCQILLDGSVVKEAESEGRYVIATCSGRI